jgi:cation/acetate symporter
MAAGFLVCIYYMLHTSPVLGGSAAGQWFHIAPISAGIFGVPAGLLTIVVVSLLTPAPGGRRRRWSTTSAHRTIKCQCQKNIGKP